MAAADPIKALRDYLKADAAVTALAGTRVYAGELPRTDVASMPRKAVVIKAAGGGLMGLSFQDYGDIRVDVDCWGETPREAWVLHLAVAQALKIMTHHVRLLVPLKWARPSSRGVSARDPDTDWPVTVSSWQVLAGETEA